MKILAIFVLCVAVAVAYDVDEDVEIYSAEDVFLFLNSSSTVRGKLINITITINSIEIFHRSH